MIIKWALKAVHVFVLKIAKNTAKVLTLDGSNKTHLTNVRGGDLYFIAWARNGAVIGLCYFVSGSTTWQS